MRKPSCCPPRRTPAPTGCDSVLLQKILACERRTIPCLHTELEITGLPAWACPPLRIVQVQQSGAQPWWTPLDSCDHCGQVAVRVTIPVCVQLCDQSGRRCTAYSLVEVETLLPRSLCTADSCRHSLTILPCVQLICAECGYQVQLHVSLECYLLCFAPCQLRSQEQICPQLPLYPPPIRPHCC